MHTDTSYRLYIQRFMKIFTFGMLTLFTVVGLLVAGDAFGSVEGGPPRLFGIFWLAMVAFYWYWVLSIPHRIDVSETGQVKFISAVRRRLTTFHGIRSVMPDAQLGFLIVRTDCGKIRIMNQFDGFHDFITRLKTANPAVELRGC